MPGSMQVSETHVEAFLFMLAACICFHSAAGPVVFVRFAGREATEPIHYSMQFMLVYVSSWHYFHFRLYLESFSIS